MKNLFTFRRIALFGLLLSFFVGFTEHSSAQKFTFNPSKTITAKWSGLESIFVDVDIDNNTNGELKLTWQILENTIPLDWVFSLCDNMSCYSYSVIPPGGADFAPVGKGEYAFFKLLFDSTGVIKEEAMIKLIVFETGKMQDGVDTVTFHIIPKTSSVTETTIPFANVLPNPATDLVHLSAFNAVQTVEVFSAMGVKVMEIANNSAEVSLDVRSLPVGVYFVKAHDIYGKTNTATFHKF